MKKITRPRGTQDILPEDSWKWQAVERKMHSTMRLFGYKETRQPTFESTDLFSRGVGEGTDIVSKEMYTFLDKSDRSMTLRPEGTAGIVRVVLENGLLASSPLPIKTYYIQSFFRYEKAQKGRLREFHQLGVECYGTHEPAADAEVIEAAASVLRALGVLSNTSLELNSIGCPACRPQYHEQLRNYFTSRKDDLCETCIERLATNPMRILDCKEAKCQQIAQDAPLMADYLCESCATHYAEVQSLLTAAGIEYRLNPRIVRGLDYYSNTVFEFVAEGIGTQGTVCGGGRYNGLIEQLGGQPTPAVGFGMGIERLLMLLEEQGMLPAQPQGLFAYLVGIGDAGRATARRIAAELRARGISAETDIAGRSVKAQMKAAGRLNAAYTMVLGDDEAAAGHAKLKCMDNGEEADISLKTPVQDIIRAVSQWQESREAAIAAALEGSHVIGEAEFLGFLE